MTSFLRRLSILEFLRVNRQPKSTEAILNHLNQGGYIDNEKTKSASLRLVQRDMQYLFGEALNDRSEDINELGLTLTRGAGKSWLWSIDPYSTLRFDYEKMPHYLAMAFAMTQKHLSTLLPHNTLAELGRFFSQADSKLQKTEQSPNSQSYHRLKDSIEFYQRGQRLQPADYDVDHLDTIYRAIISRKQLQIHYRKKNYRLHPLGVAILLPKLYLVAVKDEDASPGIDHHSASYRHFLIDKIESIYLEQKNSVSIPGFSLKAYLESGHMDVLIDPGDNGQYPLKMIIKPAKTNSNLISDLQENPLSPDQQITATGKQEQEYEMTATVRRTFQLRNWILTLGDAGRVIAPAVIRDDLTRSLQRMLAHY